MVVFQRWRLGSCAVVAAALMALFHVSSAWAAAAAVRSGGATTASPSPVAQAPTARELSVDKPLIVGTVAIAPFIIKNPDGSWGGISMDLWKRVADELHLSYEVREVPVAALFAPEKNGLDVVVSLNVSARNEETLDITHAFYSTGLSIATRTESKSAAATIASKVLTWGVLRGVGILVAILIFMGTCVWFIERKSLPDEFGGSTAKGIFAGVIWAFESLFGKGHSLSRTPGGRAFALLWTFTSVVLISGVTAKLSSELTVSQLSSSITGPQDLPKVRVGTVKPSQGARYLDQHSIPFTGYKDVPEMLEALNRGDVDAVVFESPILRYHARKSYSTTIVVLPGTFQNHGYGFGLQTNSPNRERINAAMLKIVESDEWNGVLTRYLGANSE